MSSAAEAVDYGEKLHGLVQWIGICDGNMQEGNFRCDVNVSVKKKGSTTLGTRREIKNLNSFKFILYLNLIYNFFLCCYQIINGKLMLKLQLMNLCATPLL